MALAGTGEAGLAVLNVCLSVCLSVCLFVCAQQTSAGTCCVLACSRVALQCCRRRVGDDVLMPSTYFFIKTAALPRSLTSKKFRSSSPSGKNSGTPAGTIALSSGHSRDLSSDGVTHGSQYASRCSVTHCASLRRVLSGSSVEDKATALLVAQSYASLQAQRQELVELQLELERCVVCARPPEC